MTREIEKKIWNFLETQYQPPDLGIILRREALASLMSVVSGARPTASLAPDHQPYHDDTDNVMWFAEWDELLWLTYACDLPSAPRAQDVTDPQNPQCLYVGHIPNLMYLKTDQRRGAALDYPPCCVEAYVKATQGAQNPQKRTRAMLESLGPSADEWLHHHRYLGWTTHVSCTPLCPLTHANGKRYAASARRSFPSLSRRIERAWVERSRLEF